MDYLLLKNSFTTTDTKNVYGYVLSAHRSLDHCRSVCMPSLPFIVVLVLFVAALLVAIVTYACHPSVPATEAFGRAAPGRLPDRCAAVSGATNASSYTVCMRTPSHGWCADRRGGGQCVPGGLDGPFDPEGRCANWWYAGRCQWGPLCRRVDPVVPASRERTDPYHHPAPYYYRSCPATVALVEGECRDNRSQKRA